MNTIIRTRHGLLQVLSTMACDFERLNGACKSPSNANFWDNRDIIDMDTIIVMLENPQSLSPTFQERF